MNIASVRGFAEIAPEPVEVVSSSRRGPSNGGATAGERTTLRRLTIAVALLAAILQATPAAAGSRAGPRKATAPGPAEPATIAHNAQVLQELPFSDRQDYDDAQRGFIATLPDLTIVREDGTIVFSLQEFEFLQQPEAPATVNPSLWRHAQVNLTHGLFQVTERVYQVRNFDLANMTIVEGQSGVIVIDPLTATETSKAALELYYQHRGVRPVKAVVYTHSHHDHYAGVKGVVSEADVLSGDVTVLAPEGFLDAAVSENVYAGTAMSRRASYMFGYLLPKTATGTVDDGLGKSQSVGTVSLIAPTDTITRSGETRNLDGVQIEFVMAPETEAPAEMTLYFPELRVLDAAEIACPLMHNTLTPRGAQVRDPRKWAASLDELIARYGSQADVLIASHNWPRWGRGPAVQLMADQRDLYKFMNDQTLHLLNQGYVPVEIAEVIKLPASLAKLWYVRDHYGTLKHNVKAVYQRYLGWFDGNPANLDPLPPVEAARKYVEYMGGASVVTARAQQDFKHGEYRWVAQLMNQVVFAEPDNVEARKLQAAALEQLGYQAESPIWRNFYLSGAQELRDGLAPAPGGAATGSADTIRSMTIPLLFDYWGVLLDAAKANGQRMLLNWTFTERNESYALNLSNSALTHHPGLDPAADASFTLARATLNAILLGQTDFQTEVKAGRIQAVGNVQKLAELMGMLDKFEPQWPIVTP
ncbi:alkyl/aryl-sulfatase [Anaeromyxobacter sp. SG26]|uniref:alkyl/aryl-sulfatase n=1 Tax=Anaeromyxobacter sp. SG26 TaxID=2925407 RepID=UPI001F5AE2EA|nr:alkyl sulfatase dimerization domain-containing protein [Anaeromyxobacter sp. SG26]